MEISDNVEGDDSEMPMIGHQEEEDFHLELSSNSSENDMAENLSENVTEQVLFSTYFFSLKKIFDSLDMSFCFTMFWYLFYAISKTNYFVTLAPLDPQVQFL